MALQRVLTLNDLPFTQSAQEGNPSGTIPSSAASGSIGNMQYAAATAGAAGNSISITHQLAEFAIPTEPVTPTFSGTVRTVTSEATFNSALEAAADGDILEIPANTTVTFTGQKTINKSICLRGQNRSTSRITSSFNVPANQALIMISGTKLGGAQNNNVYVHTLTITSSNNVQDHAVLSASTLSTAFNNGSSGIRFENLTLFTTEICISVAANAWVIKGCEFNYTPAGGAADTARHVYVGNIGVMGWVENCVFNCTTEATPRTIGMLLTTFDYEFAPATKSGGFSGDLVLKGNSQGTGNLRQWFVMESFKANGLNSAPMVQNGFSLWAVNNSHNNTSGGSFNLYEGSGTKAPLNFFNTMYFAGNNCGESTSTDKGIIAVDGLGSLRSAGAPTHFYVPVSSVNTGTAITTALSGTYVQGCTNTVGGNTVSPVQGNLLAINSTFYNSPSPASRLSVEAAAGTFAVNVVGNAVTVSVAPSTPATSLASSLNANGSFSALVAATAANASNASTTGSVTLSGGAG
jgi:hypothetical protein